MVDPTRTQILRAIRHSLKQLRVDANLSGNNAKGMKETLWEGEFEGIAKRDQEDVETMEWLEKRERDGA